MCTTGEAEVSKENKRLQDVIKMNKLVAICLTNCQFIIIIINLSLVLGARSNRISHK